MEGDPDWDEDLQKALELSLQDDASQNARPKRAHEGDGDGQGSKGPRIAEESSQGMGAAGAALTSSSSDPTAQQQAGGAGNGPTDNAVQSLLEALQHVVDNQTQQQQQPEAGSAAAPAPAPPAQAAGSPPPVSAAMLADMLAETMAHMQAPTAALPATAQRAPPTASPPAAPAWYGPAVEWLPEQPRAVEPQEVGPIPQAAVGELAEALQQVLACRLSLQGVGAAAAGSAGAAATAAAGEPLVLRLLPARRLRMAREGADGPSAYTLTPAVLDSVVQSRIAFRRLKGASRLAWLAQAWQRAGAASGSSAAEVVTAAIGLLRHRLAHRAAKLILEDVADDLFYENGGATHRELLQGLGADSSISPEFVDACVATTCAKHRSSWEQLVRSALAVFKGFDFRDSSVLAGHLLALDRLTQSYWARRALAALLLVEAAAMGDVRQPPMSGRQAETAAVLAPLLSVSPIHDIPIALYNIRKGRPLEGAGSIVFTELRGYPNFREGVAAASLSIANSLHQLYNAAHEVVMRVVKLKPLEDGSPLGLGREAVLAWLAGLLACNEVRTAGGDRHALDRRSLQDGASDQFMVGLTVLCMRLARPFLPSAAADDARLAQTLARLDPQYYAAQLHRVGDAATARTLVGRPFTPARRAAVFLSASLDPGQRPHFVAEVFFLAQKVLRNGLMAAVFRYNEVINEVARLQSSQQQGSDGGGGGSDGADEQLVKSQCLLTDCFEAQVLDQELAVDVVRFVGLEAAWLLALCRRGEGHDVQAMRMVPESIVQDICSWVSFLTEHGASGLVPAISISGFVEALVTMLERSSDLVRSPLVHAKIVEVLLAMQQANMRPRGAAAGAADRHAGETALVNAVLATGATQKQLVPALMRCYSAADFVEGLDVDRDNFDKFGMRHRIDLLLAELWKDRECQASLRRLANEDLARQQQQQQHDTAVAAAASSSGTPGPGASSLFVEWVGAVLNDLIYLLQDSMDRLQDIYTLEQSMADIKAWQALPISEANHKKKDGTMLLQFYESQGRTCRGFMRMAVSTLRLLNLLAADADVGRSFMQPSIVGRASYAFLHFLRTLQGPRCVNLKVANPRRYNFDPDALLRSTIELGLHLAKHPQFPPALAAEHDFDPQFLRQVQAHLDASDQGDLSMGLSALIAASEASQTTHAATGPGRNQQTLQEHKRDEAMQDAAAAAASHNSSSSTKSLFDDALRATSSTCGSADANGGDTAAGDSATATAASQSYEEAMLELSCLPFDSGLPRAYNRDFAARAAAPVDAAAAQRRGRRLDKEIRDLLRRKLLPLQPQAAIFVRYDAELRHKARALITGPADTPYGYGCFLFDVMFPADYPNVPPLMVLDTTGEGRVRFNPNLYADGKVCLSLLGTWHGSNAWEKWDPNSSLLQLLVSIQGMILIPDPYFNEPMVDSMRDTAEGASRSEQYNAEVQLNTIRWAMVDQLKHKRPGFEQVVEQHFRLLRKPILQQCQTWLQAAASFDPGYQRRLAEAVLELHSLLQAL